jgi:hypothetical protein
MDKRKLNRVFKEIKTKANLDYAITNTDEYGDCNTCVNYELADVFGVDSKGIYAKHWLKGMNAGRPWKHLDSVYIGHDLTEVQGKILIDVFKANGYDIKPEVYDPNKAFEIKEI